MSVDPSTPLRVLAVVNDPTSGLGRFADWLVAEGVSWESVSGDEIPCTADGFDAVLLLGGGFMPDAYDRAPWLHAEAELVRQALRDEVPILGICLGAQVLAQVAGGTVCAGFGEQERGSIEVELLPAAADDPLFTRLPSTFAAIANHRDQITELPSGAVHLARSAACTVQAFRIGTCAWGVQFHPEAGADRLERWDGTALAESGWDLAALRAAASAVEPASAEAARRLLGAWVAAIRRAAAAAAVFGVLDGHNDLPWVQRLCADSSVDGLADVGEHRHTDLPRLRAGGVTGQFWSVYVDGADPDPVRATLQQIDLVHRMIERYPDDLEFAWSGQDVRAANAAGRIASLLGAEGGHSIGDDLAVLRDFARLGVRYMTLTHNDDTSWADSATGTHPHGGLTDRGREIVAQMQRIGMLVDLSHVSAATMHDALDIASAPVIFSHSGAHAVCPHPRNVPDDVLVRLRDNGGLVMVTFVASFVSRAWSHWSKTGRVGPEPAVTIGDVADHVEHVRDVAGIAHVGIGGDYDGTTFLPNGLGDVSCYPALAHELARRGWTPAQLRALASGNITRVLDASDRPFRHI
ncbi:MAG: membrane dipeptidase [Gordonia sp. (in: high G+C Gram-positive bacteria)]